MAAIDPELVGQDVVIDTGTPMLYIGRLASVQDGTAVMEDVDVHDINDTNTTKELYILEALKYGIKKNRKQVSILLERIVSVSRLEDIIDY